MKVDKRHLWAADVLNVQPDDKLLEVGCGPGITADMVAKKLATGSLHLLDRSSAMIKQASIRNQQWIDNGTVRLIEGSFGKVMLPLEYYDKVYCFNVSLFLKESYEEFAQLKKLIGTTGSFFLFSQPPFDQTKNTVKEAQQHLQQHGFTIINTKIAPFQPAPTFCVIVKNHSNRHKLSHPPL